MRRTPDSAHVGDSELEALFWGDLEETRQVEVRSHLEKCPACREALADLEEFAAVAGPPEDPAEREAGRRLATSILVREQRLERWRKVALALAMSLFVVTVGSVIFHSLQDGAPQSDVVRAELVEQTIRGRTRIEIDGRVQTIELAVIPKSFDPETRYSVAIEDTSGRTLFTTSDLGTTERALTVDLPRSVLEPGGEFELVLTAGAGASRVEISRFGFEAIFR